MASDSKTYIVNYDIRANLKGAQEGLTQIEKFAQTTTNIFGGLEKTVDSVRSLINSLGNLKPTIELNINAAEFRATLRQMESDVIQSAERMQKAFANALNPGSAPGTIRKEFLKNKLEDTKKMIKEAENDLKKMLGDSSGRSSLGKTGKGKDFYEGSLYHKYLNDDKYKKDREKLLKDLDEQASALEKTKAELKKEEARLTKMQPSVAAAASKAVAKETSLANPKVVQGITSELQKAVDNLVKNLPKVPVQFDVKADTLKTEVKTTVEGVKAPPIYIELQVSDKSAGNIRERIKQLSGTAPKPDPNKSQTPAPVAPPEPIVTQEQLNWEKTKLEKLQEQVKKAKVNMDTAKEAYDKRDRHMHPMDVKGLKEDVKDTQSAFAYAEEEFNKQKANYEKLKKKYDEAKTTVTKPSTSQAASASTILTPAEETAIAAALKQLDELEAKLTNLKKGTQITIALVDEVTSKIPNIVESINSIPKAHEVLVSPTLNNEAVAQLRQQLRELGMLAQTSALKANENTAANATVGNPATKTIGAPTTVGPPLTEEEQARLNQLRESPDFEKLDKARDAWKRSKKGSKASNDKFEAYRKALRSAQEKYNSLNILEGREFQSSALTPMTSEEQVKAGRWQRIVNELKSRSSLSSLHKKILATGEETLERYRKGTAAGTSYSIPITVNLDKSNLPSQIQQIIESIKSVTASMPVKPNLDESTIPEQVRALERKANETPIKLRTQLDDAQDPEEKKKGKGKNKTAETKSAVVAQQKTAETAEKTKGKEVPMGVDVSLEEATKKLNAFISEYNNKTIRINVETIFPSATPIEEHQVPGKSKTETTPTQPTEEKKKAKGRGKKKAVEAPGAVAAQQQASENVEKIKGGNTLPLKLELETSTAQTKFNTFLLENNNKTIRINVETIFPSATPIEEYQVPGKSKTETTPTQPTEEKKKGKGRGKKKAVEAPDAVVAQQQASENVEKIKGGNTLPLKLELETSTAQTKFNTFLLENNNKTISITVDAIISPLAAKFLGETQTLVDQNPVKTGTDIDAAKPVEEKKKGRGRGKKKATPEVPGAVTAQQKVAETAEKINSTSFISTQVQLETSEAQTKFNTFLTENNNKVLRVNVDTVLTPFTASLFEQVQTPTDKNTVKSKNEIEVPHPVVENQPEEKKKGRGRRKKNAVPETPPAVIAQQNVAEAADKTNGNTLDEALAKLQGKKINVPVNVLLEEAQTKLNAFLSEYNNKTITINAESVISPAPAGNATSAIDAADQTRKTAEKTAGETPVAPLTTNTTAPSPTEDTKSTSSDSSNKANKGKTAPTKEETKEINRKNNELLKYAEGPQQYKMIRDYQSYFKDSYNKLKRTRGNKKLSTKDWTKLSDQDKFNILEETMQRIDKAGMEIPYQMQAEVNKLKALGVKAAQERQYVTAHNKWLPFAQSDTHLKHLIENDKFYSQALKNLTENGALSTSNLGEIKDADRIKLLEETKRLMGESGKKVPYQIKSEIDDYYDQIQKAREAERVAAENTRARNKFFSAATGEGQLKHFIEYEDYYDKALRNYNSQFQTSTTALADLDVKGRKWVSEEVERLLRADNKPMQMQIKSDIETYQNQINKAEAERVKAAEAERIAAENTRARNKFFSMASGDSQLKHLIEYEDYYDRAFRNYATQFRTDATALTDLDPTGKKWVSEEVERLLRADNKPLPMQIKSDIEAYQSQINKAKAEEARIEAERAKAAEAQRRVEAHNKYFQAASSNPQLNHLIENSEYYEKALTELKGRGEIASDKLHELVPQDRLKVLEKTKELIQAAGKEIPFQIKTEMEGLQARIKNEVAAEQFRQAHAKMVPYGRDEKHLKHLTDYEKYYSDALRAHGMAYGEDRINPALMTDSDRLRVLKDVEQSLKNAGKGVPDIIKKNIENFEKAIVQNRYGNLFKDKTSLDFVQKNIRHFEEVAQELGVNPSSLRSPAQASNYLQEVLKSLEESNIDAPKQIYDQWNNQKKAWAESAELKESLTQRTKENFGTKYDQWVEQQQAYKEAVKEAKLKKQKEIPSRPEPIFGLKKGFKLEELTSGRAFKYFSELESAYYEKGLEPPKEIKELTKNAITKSEGAKKGRLNRLENYISRYTTSEGAIKGFIEHRDAIARVASAHNLRTIEDYLKLQDAQKLKILKEIRAKASIGGTKVPKVFQHEIESLESGAGSSIFDKTQGYKPRKLSAFDRMRKWAYPFSGSTSFGSNTPMMVDMAKGMGVMFAVGGAMSAIGSSFSQAMEYQNTMEATKAILQHGTDTYTPSNFTNMEHIIRDVGIKTKFSAPEVANAARFLAMAGQDIESINSSIRPIADIALIGGTDLGETADKMTNIMTTFEIAPERMREVANILTTTATRSNTDLMMLAESAKYGGGVAHMYGKNDPNLFADTMALFGVMGNAGIQGSSAGTALRMMYQNIFNPNKNQAAVLQALEDKYQIKTKNADGSFRGMAEFVGDVARNVTDQQELATVVSKLFRITAQPGANAALLAAAGGDLETYNELLKSGQTMEARLLEEGGLGKLAQLMHANRLSITGNISGEVADKMQNTIEGLWAQVTSTFTEGIVKAFESRQGGFENMLKDLRDYLARPETVTMLKNLLDLIVNIGKVMARFVELWAKLYSMFPGVIQFWAMIQMVFTQFGSLLSPMVGLLGVFNRFGTWFEKMKPILEVAPAAAAVTTVAETATTAATSVAAGAAVNGASAVADAATGLVGSVANENVVPVTPPSSGGTIIGPVDNSIPDSVEAQQSMVDAADAATGVASNVSQEPAENRTQPGDSDSKTSKNKGKNKNKHGGAFGKIQQNARKHNAQGAQRAISAVAQAHAVEEVAQATAGITPIPSGNTVTSPQPKPVITPPQTPPVSPTVTAATPPTPPVSPTATAAAANAAEAQAAARAARTEAGIIGASAIAASSSANPAPKASSSPAGTPKKSGVIKTTWSSVKSGFSSGRSASKFGNLKSVKMPPGILGMIGGLVASLLSSFSSIIGWVTGPIGITTAAMIAAGSAIYRVAQLANGTTEAQIRAFENTERLADQARYEREKHSKWFNDFINDPDNPLNKKFGSGIIAQADLTLTDDASREYEEMMNMRKKLYVDIAEDDLIQDASHNRNLMAGKKWVEEMLDNQVNRLALGEDYEERVKAIYAPQRTVSYNNPLTGGRENLGLMIYNGTMVDKPNAEKIQNQRAYDMLYAEGARDPIVKEALNELSDVHAKYLTGKIKLEEYNVIVAGLRKKYIPQNLEKIQSAQELGYDAERLINHSNLSQFREYQQGLANFLEANFDPNHEGSILSYAKAVSELQNKKLEEFSDVWYENIGHLLGRTKFVTFIEDANKQIKEVELQLRVNPGGKIDQESVFRQIKGQVDGYEENILAMAQLSASVYKMLADKGYIQNGSLQGAQSFISDQLADNTVIDRTTAEKYFDNVLAKDSSWVRHGLTKSEWADWTTGTLMQQTPTYQTPDGSVYYVLSKQLTKMKEWAAKYSAGKVLGEDYDERMKKLEEELKKSTKIDTPDQKPYGPSPDQTPGGKVQATNINIDTLVKVSDVTVGSQADKDDFYAALAPTITNAVLQMFSEAANQSAMAQEA